MTDQSEDRRILEAATPGPWNVSRSRRYVKEGVGAPWVCEMDCSNRQWEENAAYIAHFDPPKITALLNNEKAQAEEIERLRAALGEIKHQLIYKLDGSHYCISRVRDASIEIMDAALNGAQGAERS